eukprot:CAMPEP_0182449684 /NCGR_PEP_ID=MMETSP1172-20130603/36057_1 /TAXON_ID=708627 /ORGANISM="Timspurckia oligopyrenoides, Strain CCMP3278" /LENGTH=256 /DNA_ID=CAMNT_0024647035 /DNA_START=265 /DNA_END=1032 /DNA_ORIENTATION=+
MASSGSPLTIGIIGFGNFGQFLAKRFISQGHTVIGQSRSDYSSVASSLGAHYTTSLSSLFTEFAPLQILILSTSIMSTSSIIASLPSHVFPPSLLIIDVLSVKTYPKSLLIKHLPRTTDILCTHPMFGPESGKLSWTNLPFVYEKVRITNDTICEQFLDIFRNEGCSLVEMTCEDHDKYAASTQFVTHTTGRMLEQLEVRSTPINTKGFESLLDVVDTTTKDSFDLYYGLYKYNPNAEKELEKMEAALKSIRKKLE